jgi:O-succinylbenzoic acid--CoA ligase
MQKTFNRTTVLNLPEDSSSMQVNRAVTFCKDWLAGQEEFVFHTSGSTGPPKPIQLYREQMKASAQATIKYLGLSSSEQILVCLNTHFIAGTMMLVRGLELGCDITVVEPSASVVQSLAKDHPYTFASFVPFQLAKVDAGKLARFRNILVGGGPLRDDMEQQLSTIPAAVWHTYGMTETVSHIALKRVGRDKYFHAMPGIELKVDEEQRLCIRGAVTRNQWLVTHDHAVMHGDSGFTITGRADAVINSGGVKIQPEVVHVALNETLIDLGLPHVESFITGTPHPRLGEQVTAVFLKAPVVNESLFATLEKRLTEKLGKYEVPRRWLVADTFSYLPGGKLDRLSTLAKALNT